MVTYHFDGGPMDRTELVFGSGEVYFDRFAPGTRVGEGERYIGNTSSLQMERRFEFAEARRSVAGMRTKSIKTPTSEDVLLSFVTDSINFENIKDWIGGEDTATTVDAAASNTETITLKAGRFYQLGRSIAPATGVRNLFATSVQLSDGSYITGRLYIDEVNGRVGVPASATDLNGMSAEVSYELRASAQVQFTQTNVAVRGSLRFIGRNTVGANRNYFFPHVLLSPRDQWQLKNTNEWQTLTFEADVLENFVVYETGSVGNAYGEDAITDEGMTLSDFIMAEDLLHGVVNITMPSRGY